MAKTALFTNFTDKEFIGYWDGKGKKFAPGASLYMPDYLARHFAKHLTNQELLRTNAQGNLIHKNGDKMTSPKKPEEVPMFMDLFNKSYTADETDDSSDKKDDIDSLISVANKNRQERGAKIEMPEDVAGPENPRNTPTTPSEKPDPTKPQVILPPDFDSEDETKE